MDKVDGVIISLPFALLILGYILGGIVGIENMEKQAIKAGHAHWVPDESGKPTFKWKNIKEE